MKEEKDKGTNQGMIGKMTSQKVIFSLNIQCPIFRIWQIDDKCFHSVLRESGRNNLLPICYTYKFRPTGAQSPVVLLL